MLADRAYGRLRRSFSGELLAATGERLPFTTAPASNEDDELYRVEPFEPSTGAVLASGDSIVFNGDERGVMVPTVTRCRFIKKRVVLADGTTTQIVVQVCG